jgi:hypothetical protein
VIGNTLELGIDVTNGEGVYLTPRERLENVVVFGATGTGKSSAALHWLRQLAIDHPQSGCGGLVIDRPGTLVDETVGWMAANDVEAPTLLIDTSQDRWVTGYNPLLRRAGKEDVATAREAMTALVHARGDESTAHTPLFEDTAVMVFQTLLATGMTLAEAEHLLSPDDNPVRDAIVARLPDGSRLARFWAEYAAKTRNKRILDTASTRVRLSQLCGSPTLRRVMGQPCGIDWRDVMDEGVIALVSLATSSGGESDTSVLASMMLSDLWNRAQERPAGSRPFYVLIDEFSTLLTPALTAALPRNRKHGVGFTLVTQMPAQIKRRNAKLFDETMGNTGCKVAFRLDHAGARAVADDLGVEPRHVTRLEPRHAIVRLPSNPRPRFIRIPDLLPLRAELEFKQAWVDAQVRRFPGWVLSREQAEHNLRARAESLMKTRTVTDDGEPEAFARRVQARRPAKAGV